MTIQPPKGRFHQKTESSFLSQAFVTRLQQEARKYRLIEKARTRKQFHFAELVTCEWEQIKDREDLRGEITKNDYYVECSYWINAELPFPIIGASGETLRRWCEVYESSKQIPAFDEMKQTLTFDHFEKARWLAKHSDKVSVPSFALATAIEMEFTAREMVEHFEAGHGGVHPYDRAIGWIDSLQGIKFEWLGRDERERAVRLLSELRELLEATK